MSKNRFKAFLTRIWRDPVFSKLIAALIITIVSGIWGYIYFSQKQETVAIKKDGELLEQTFLRTEEIGEIEGRFLEELLDFSLDIEWSDGYDFVYEGYYSYYLPTNGKRVLHGDFYFIMDKWELDTLITGYELGDKIIYAGQFEHGLLSGEVQNKYIHAGVDSFADYLITLFYDGSSSKCYRATFEGAIGNNMTNAKYTFDNPGSCGFDSIIELVAKQEQTGSR